jgi:leader peptidase (prepilin peptidase)/N-methyltransferase
MKTFINPEWDIFIIAFIYGLVIGSFLNVCIYRIPRRGSILFPGSFCPSCGTPIKFYDNIPVVSYVLLLGRCRFCGTSISPIYPLVELGTSSLFLILLLRFGISLKFLFASLLASISIVLMSIDYRHKILPNVLTLSGVVLGFIFSLFCVFISWKSSLAGILVGGGLLLLVSFLYRMVTGREGMGMGDVKMMMMVGAFLGWKLAVLTIILGSFLGSVIGVSIAAKKKAGMKLALPFGTFLGLATIFSLIWGTSIVDWYLGMIK